MKTHFTLWIYILVLLLPIGVAAQDKLKIKDPGGNVLMEVRPEGVLVRKVSTVERLAVVGLTSGENGLIVYDTDTKSLWLWRDTQWIEVDGVDLVDDADSDPTNELDSWLTLPGIPPGFSDGTDDVNDADSDPTNELDSWSTLPGIPAGFSDGTDDVNDADSDPTNELDTWTTLPGIPAGFADGTDDVNDADSDPTNELDTWSTLPGIPTGFSDGTDDVNDADSDPTNELDTWATLPGVPSGFSDGVDNVNDADSDPTNELDTWTTLPGIPAGFSDGVDNVNDADSDPTNELQNWSNLPGIPSGFSDGTDNVNDADSDPLNEKNITLTRNGTHLELTDAGGMLSTNIGWAVDAGKVFNTADNVGIGTSTPGAKFTVQGGAILINGTTGATPVSGAGTRLMWVPSKQAFRAGAVGAAQWDDANIGVRSFVGGGLDNVASGLQSIVAGGRLDSAIATGAFAAGGFDNTASGNNSVAGGGFGNKASGSDAFVGGGVTNNASGGTSFVAGGLSNVASGYASFVTGRESIASGNHSFAAGLGLSAKSFNETVFGTYNTDYTPVSTLGFNTADRLFVIGKGTNSSNRSNAMTILKSGNIGMGTDVPQAGLHVVGSKGLGQHIMLIENTNHEGSGLKIKIAGSHPMWVQGDGENPDFFITRPVSAIETIFEDVGGDIRDYLLSDQGFSLENVNLSQIADPAGMIDNMGLTEFLSGGICKGVSSLVDLANNTLLQPFYLPDLPLDGLAPNLIDIPLIPLLPTVAPFSINLPDPPAIWIPWPVGEYVGFTIPNVNFPATTINTPINTFNSGITTVNSGITNVNGALETGYDFLKDGLMAIDHYQVTPPQLVAPTSIGFIDCPNPNPWDDFDIAFERLNPLDYNILNPLSNDNHFITFVDAYDNKLGAITGQSIAEFNLDYFKLEKVIEIGSYVVGMFSVDGSIVKNVMKLGKEAISFYKAADKLGVEYSSGHGDYAEWLERADHAETIGFGDIVGIRGGKVSLSTDGAEQVMVVSKAPIVRGNIPDPENEINGNNIAFIGQVPVKVMGPVTTGDYIIANPETPGYGIAVAEKEITPDQLTLAVGRSWDTNTALGFKFVNTIVGMHNSGWAAPVTKLQQRIESNEAAIQMLAARLDNLENSTSVADGNKKSRF